MEKKIIELINQRRRQMIVHSIIYYRYGTSVISDTQFDKLAKELVVLQEKYPQESKVAIYNEYFEDWDATTGFQLTDIPEMHAKAEYVMDLHTKFQGTDLL